MNDGTTSTLGGLIVGLIVIVIITFLFAFTKVGAGERGVVLNWGAVQDVILDEGLHFKIPIYQKIKVLDVKTVKHEVQALSYSKDIQTVDATVALNYHLDPNGVGVLLQEIGTDFESRIIDPSIQESVKAATALFTAQELVSKRPEVKDAIRVELLKRLEGKHIVVDDFSIINFDFSDAYEQAIEQKQTAQQNALKAGNDLKRIQFEADQRVATATAEAEAIRIQAEAITQSGGKDYVNLKAVEKWNGQLPTQMIPGSAIPFINLTN